MKRYPLLIQLIIYVFVFILLLLGLVGSLYYQTSSATIGQLTERTTRNSIDQSSQFITSYLKKLKQTTSVLSKEETVRQFAQDKEVSLDAGPEGILVFREGQVGDFYHPGSGGCFWSKSRSFAPRY